MVCSKSIDSGLLLSTFMKSAASLIILGADARPALELPPADRNAERRRGPRACRIVPGCPPSARAAMDSETTPPPRPTMPRWAESSSECRGNSDPWAVQELHGQPLP